MNSSFNNQAESMHQSVKTNSISALSSVSSSYNVVIVIGGTVMDLVENCTSTLTIHGTSNPGRVTKHFW
jgi:hydroxyethylthiazole kinase-like sugar kinase family protein